MNKAVRYEEYLEIISAQLQTMHNMIISLHMGLFKENIEKQALDCIECIDFCVLHVIGIVNEGLDNLGQNATDRKDSN